MSNTSSKKDKMPNDLKAQTIKMIDVYLRYYELGDKTILPFLDLLSHKVETAIKAIEQLEAKDVKDDTL